MKNNLEAFLNLKSLSRTRWAGHWEAVEAIEKQVFEITTAMVKILEIKEAKLSVDSKSLSTAFCNSCFIWDCLFYKSYVPTAMLWLYISKISKLILLLPKQLLKSQ